jgi:hypothetical protein
MKVHFEQSGGYAGVTISKNLDTATLSEEDRKEFYDLLRNSLILEKAPESSPPSTTDLFTFKFEVRDSVSFKIPGAPPKIEAVIDFLKRLGK